MEVPLVGVVFGAADPVFRAPMVPGNEKILFGSVLYISKVSDNTIVF